MSYIRNSNSYAVVNGTSSDDTIYNSGITHYSQLNGGAGNDSIYNEQGNSVTIRGGTGNDTIRIMSLYANNNVIQYNEGDGNDYFIDEWNPSSPNWTLQIGDGTGTYSTTKSGSDKIVNVGSGKITLAGMGSKSVNIAGTYSTAPSGGVINNSMSGVSLTSTAGNDSIKNSGNNVTIDGGSGADTVYNYNGDYSSINAGDGADSIHAYDNDYVTVNAGAGNDTVTGSYYDSKIYGGDGNDKLTGNYYWDSSIIDGGNGEDTIIAKSGSVNGGAGNDSIKVDNSGYALTVKGGTGNDTIVGSTVYTVGTLYQYTSGDGNDSMNNFKTSDTLQIGGGTGTYSSQQSGSDILVTVGSGIITLSGVSSANIIGVYKDPLLVSLTSGNDTYSNTLSNATIFALGGNDSVTNSGASVSVDLGNNNNYLYNTGNRVSVIGGSGADTVFNDSDYSSINTGDGNDSIKLSHASSTSVNSGAGADYISLDHSDYDSIYAGEGNDTVTGIMGLTYIDGGTGNDLISIGGGTLGGKHTIRGGAGNDTLYGNSHSPDGQLFLYSTGDGNDLIKEFDSSDTLQIGGGTGTYSSQQSGSDILVTVGSGVITLSGVSSANIIGVYKDPLLVSLTSGNDTYNNALSNATIFALGGNDSVTNSGASVSVDLGNNNNYLYNTGNRVSVIGGSGADTVYNNNGDYSSINAGDGADSIHAYDNDYVTVNAGAGNDTVTGSYYDSKIYGGDGNDKLTGNYYWDSSIIDGGNGEDTIIAKSGSVNGGAGNDSIKVDNSGYALTVKGGTGNDTIVGSTVYTVGTLYQYTSGDGNDSMHNFKTSDTLQIGNGTSDTYSKSTIGSNVLVSVGSGVITLNGTASLSSVNILGTEVPLETNAWTISGTTAKYGISSKTLATVNGLKSGLKASNGEISGITLNDKVITLSKSVLDTSTVTVSGDGYTLKLGSDVKAPSTSQGWSLKDTTATYNQTTTAGYKLADDSKSIAYSQSSSKTFATVNGVKSIDGLSLSGNVVTVSAASLGTSKVSISGDGYTLKLGKGVEPPTTSQAWSLKDTTATYNQTTTSGYKLAGDSKSITYSQSSSKTLATVNGVKSLDGLSLSGNVITVSAASLGTSKVSISGDGYTLKLGKGVEPPTTSQAWSLKKTMATYNQTTTAGYKLAGDSKSIAYSKPLSKTLATVKGVKSLNGLSLKKKVVTVSKASLGTSNVSISGDGYTLKLGKGVEAPATKKAAFSLDGSTATYNSSYKTAGYTLASNSKSISYSTETKPSALATIKGAKSTSGLSISGKKITLKNSALKNKVTVSGGYEFNFASDYKQSTITGSAKADTITANGSKLSINGGKGNDTIKVLGSSDTVKGGAGSDVFIYKAGTSGVIADYATEDTISITSGSVEVTTRGSDVIFSVGKGKITVTGGKDKTISYVDSGGKKTYTYTASTDLKYSKDKTAATLLAKYDPDEFDFSKGLLTLDASKVTHELMIVGNKEANEITGTKEDDTIDGGEGADTIRGGKGSDSIYGGKGSDSLHGGENSDTLWGGIGDDYLDGGDGYDTFLYTPGDGIDRIFNYDVNEDTIKLIDGKVKNTEAVGLDVVFTIGKGQQIILDNAANKSAYVVDGSDQTIALYTPKTKT